MQPIKIDTPKKAELTGAVLSKIKSYSKVPVLYQTHKIPQSSIPSLTRLTKIAFWALFTAARRWDQYPIKRYEQTPIPSHPIIIMTKLSEVTRMSIKKVNNER